MNLERKPASNRTLNDGEAVPEEARNRHDAEGADRSIRRRCRIAIEVGTHSPWVIRLLTRFGHEVIVANARQVKLISASSRKDGWTPSHWRGWREWTRCCDRSGIGVRKRSKT